MKKKVIKLALDMMAEKAEGVCSFCYKRHYKACNGICPTKSQSKKYYIKKAKEALKASE